ncbi:uncharacterized protein LOC117181681 [Belonocnema kinseyi]|uniref:uncharacterized protein LOC117181681 n=1 Tax=Belonocnema kinseyi TaxID=2817044 RepID=UPI00143D2EAE|nr:uncharacterized protein LOC117181681 [Belonocnema kinseyi]XP_033230486.1 uncharacterized protein LOC117181681 [Belonocnema kinseyi]XP_033230487.1 uncharacterized protein LOC117181681 [Belonocnema kinseyi]
MRTISALFYSMTVWLSAKAITVSVDRADYQPPQKHASISGNGWRPVTGYDEINIKVSPTSKGQRFAAPLHPVIGKLQEHLGSSHTLKLQNANRPSDFAPPTILGSFSVFSRATAKTREDPTLNIKLLPSESRKYSFLLSPNRDLFHSTDTQYISKTPNPDIRDPSYYYNGPRYASTASSLMASRPLLYTYNVQQTLQPPDRPPLAFEYKNSNSQYLVPPGFNYSKDFGKNKSNQQYYNQNSHSPNFQPSNAKPNNYFNHVNHPSPYKVTYERNPAYLIHESHEVDYVTPPFEMKFKPYQNYLMPPEVYTSTLPPTKINYLQPLPINVNNESHSENVDKKLKNDPTNNKLNHKNRHQKYKQEFVNNTENFYVPEHESAFIYMPPETQQYFRKTIKPIEQTTEKEYETPESISLKHYKEQLARLAILKNRQRFRDHEQTREQELQTQQYEEHNRQPLEQKYFNKEEMLKPEAEKTRNAGSKKPPVREEYQVEKIRSPQTAISGNRFPVNEGKAVEHLEVNVPKQPTTSRHSTTTHQPIIYYQTTQSSQKKKDESPQEYWEQNVQYPAENLSSTRIPEDQPQSQKYSVNGELQIISFYPESVTTDTSIHSSEITEGVTDVPVYPIILPEIIIAPSTERIINHRPSGKRRRRPTVATQEPHNIPSKTKQNFSERENSSGEFIRRNQAKAQQTKYEEPVVERKTSSRRRPEVSVRVNKNELDVQTETVNPTKYKTPKEGLVVYVTEYPNFDQKASTENTESVLENLEIEHITEPVNPSWINNSEYVTEPVKPVRINNYDYVTELTRPSRINNYNEFQKTDYIVTTTPVTSTTPFTTTKELQSSTTAASTVSTTKPTYRFRPSRFGNTSRPRFSVKEYKSRLDYKNRISHSSSTEDSVETPVKQRPTVDQKKKQQSEPAVRESTGKYKYMSRVSYRTSSTTPATEDQANLTFTTNTRNKGNKFSPKQRQNNSYPYRSRATSTTSTSIKQEGDGSPTIRLENIFSSIRHRSPVMRSKLRSSKEPSETKDNIEMAIEETNFYSHPTSQHEISEEIKVTLSNNERNQEQKEISEIQENVSIKEKPEPDSLKVKYEITPINDLLTTATKQADEELFEKASQSVADLTSSASALYDKPGLFKAVSPPTENRIISTHLKITTGETTLPIEAFFHNLADKVR